MRKYVLLYGFLPSITATGMHRMPVPRLMWERLPRTHFKIEDRRLEPNIANASLDLGAPSRRRRNAVDVVSRPQSLMTQPFPA